MPSDHTTKQEQPPSASDYQSGSSHPLVKSEQSDAQAYNSAQSTAAAQNNQDIAHPQERERRMQNWLLVVFTGLIFIVTTVYSYFSYGQWTSMDKTRELEYRAYVAVKGVSIVPKPLSDGMGNVIVSFANTGRTPALEAEVITTLVSRENPIPEDAPPTLVDTKPSRSVIPPLTDMTQNPGEVPIVQIQIIPTNGQKTPLPTPSPTPTPLPNANNLQYYVYGLIKYTDIFEHHHQTKFCFVNTPGTNAFHACANYNSFD